MTGTAVASADGDDDNVVSFEEWLTGKPAAKPAPRPTIAAPAVALVGHADAYARKAIDEECATLAATTEGSRNHQLNVCAFKLASLVDAGRADRDATIAQIADAARRCGLDESEIGPTINSAFRGSAAKVGARVVPELEPIAPAYVLEDVASMQGALPEGTACIPTDEDVERPQPGMSANDDEDGDDTPTVATLEEIEGDFWTARPHLTLIRDAALARMASPWAVLACCMARALAAVPPNIVLPPIIGGEGSLNWFAAISAKSGGGKGAAMAVAEQLMPHDVTVKGIGSGEGMIEAYQRSGGDKKDPPPPVTSILFSIEEIDSLGAMGGRSGQTTMAILRQGFSGEKLGYSYRGRQGETVAKHSYRMTVVASVQPERAGTLFDDAGGGTPQRFMWFPGRDKRIDAHPRPWPGGTIKLPRALDDAAMEAEVVTGADGSAPLRSVRVPETAAQTIRDARAASMSGDDNALNSHALFVREKFAFGLALLDGRLNAVSDDDWELSGVAAAVSDWCRGKAHAGYMAGVRRLSRERGALRAEENDELSLVGAAMAQQRVSRIALAIVRHLGKHGPQTEGQLHKRQSGRDRPGFPSALRSAAEAGLIVKRDDRWELPK